MSENAGKLGADFVDQVSVAADETDLDATVSKADDLDFKSYVSSFLEDGSSEGNMAFIPGRIDYFFMFSGSNFAVNTACSSGLAGIQMACNSLWQGGKK
ncbi:hypothetical protein B0T17DRAFT_617317 [Bombardia bombarda]|uniref:Beta-ketoacyl synthase-like N-terminal domain-containing protein n=1 Tax=Bombardia bombarda TaxID=252184 RepID=A0AA39X0U2_9PEZI|nr:hypothetical protein B0T17DRAFT_617317 [Bombardia bombarda]